MNMIDSVSDDVSKANPKARSVTLGILCIAHPQCLSHTKAMLNLRLGAE
jgi:hypothetical protein